MSTDDPATSTFTIFYSWQVVSPNETNRSAIRQAIVRAAAVVELENAGLKIVIDEATREMPGSPNIPQTIMEKINACDAFIGDITIINAASPEAQRRTPNPNVVFELGYAVAHLGWGRVVLVFIACCTEI